MSKNLKRSELAGSVRNYYCTVPGNAAQFVVLRNSSNKYFVEIIDALVVVAADANAANRYARFVLNDAKGRYRQGITTPVTIANNTSRFSFSSHVGTMPTATLDGWAALPLPCKQVSQFETLEFICSGGLAGDVIDVNVNFRIVGAVTNV